MSDVAMLLTLDDKAAAEALERFTKGVSEQADEMKKATKQAASGFDEIRDKIKELSQEHRQQARETRLLVGVLGGALPAGAHEAAEALSAFAIGGPIGLGVAALKIGFEHFGEEAAKTAEKMKTLSTETITLVTDLKQKWLDYFETLDKKEEGHSAVIFREARKRLTLQRDEIAQRLGDAEKAVAEELGKEIALRNGGTVGIIAAEVTKWKNMEKLQEAAAQGRHELARIDASLASNIALEGEGKRKEAHLKERTETKSHHEEIARIVAEVTHKGLGERERIVAEYNARFAKLRAGDGAAEIALAGAMNRELFMLKKKKVDEDYKLAQEYAKKAKEEELKTHLEELKIERDYDIQSEFGTNAHLVTELQAFETHYADLLEKVSQNEELYNQIVSEYQTKREQIIRKANMDELASFVSTVRTVTGPLENELKNSLHRLMSENQRFTAAFTAASDERRIKTLIEQNVVKNYAEGQRYVAEEHAAAEQKKTADLLEQIAIRAGEEALFESAKAVATFGTPEFVQHVAAAIAFGAIAGGTGYAAYASNQDRGFTADEHDQLQQLAASTTDSGTRASGGAGGGTSGQTIVRETVFVIADAGETEAEAAARFAKRYRRAQDLDQLRR